MLDPKIIRGEPERIRKMLRDRVVEFDFDKMLELDKKRRDLIRETDELRQKRNQMSVSIGQAKKSNMDTSPLLADMEKISKVLDDQEQLQKIIESDYTNLAFSIPNMIHESVPIGGDESANVELRKWGDVPQFNFQVSDHIDLGQNLNIIDLERAAKTAGARFYYLKGDLVKLSQSLISFALDFMAQKQTTHILLFQYQT